MKHVTQDMKINKNTKTECNEFFSEVYVNTKSRHNLCNFKVSKLASPSRSSPSVYIQYYSDNVRYVCV